MIDEAGRNDQAVSVDDALRARSADAAGFNDASGLDRDIAVVARLPGTIDDAAVSNEQIKHPGLLMVIIFFPAWGRGAALLRVMLRRPGVSVPRPSWHRVRTA